MAPEKCQLQFAGVCTYMEHERYLLKLLSHMSRDPPPSCQRTSVAQLVAADKAVWTRMVENGISPKKDSMGDHPVSKALIPTLESYDVTIHLLPRYVAESQAKKRPHPNPKHPPPPPEVQRTDGKGLVNPKKGVKEKRA